jgi:hypothetical protein
LIAKTRGLEGEDGAVVGGGAIQLEKQAQRRMNAEYYYLAQKDETDW